MNICIVDKIKLAANAGGVESVCYNYATMLSKNKNHKIFQFYYQGFAPDIPGIVYKQLPSNIQNADEKDLEDFRCFIQQNDINIIWNHSGHDAINRFLYRVSQKTDIRIISILHSTPLDIFKELRDRHDLALYQLKYNGALKNYIATTLKLPLSYLNAYRKSYISLSRKLKYCHKMVLLSARYIDEYLRLCFKWKSNKITAITNPLLPKKIQSPVQKKNQVLVVARHVWKHKRLDRIIKIWSKIEKDFTDWELIILGDGPAHADYVELAERLNLEHVCFPGQIAPDQYYAESKIICMTSGWEGLPMALLEAQQYGCVPISYESFSALPDIIENGKTGYRIPPFKENVFIEKLRHLMSAPQELEHMAENCQIHAKNFEIDKTAQQWMELFEQIIQESHAN